MCLCQTASPTDPPLKRPSTTALHPASLAGLEITGLSRCFASPRISLIIVCIFLPLLPLSSCPIPHFRVESVDLFSFFPNLVILSFPVTRFHPPLILSHPRLPPACSSAFDLARTIDVSLPARQTTAYHRRLGTTFLEIQAITHQAFDAATAISSRPFYPSPPVYTWGFLSEVV